MEYNFLKFCYKTRCDFNGTDFEADLAPIHNGHQFLRVTN